MWLILALPNGWILALAEWLTWPHMLKVYDRRRWCNKVLSRSVLFSNMVRWISVPRHGWMMLCSIKSERTYNDPNGAFMSSEIFKECFTSFRLSMSFCVWPGIQNQASRACQMGIHNWIRNWEFSEKDASETFSLWTSINKAPCRYRTLQHQVISDVLSSGYYITRPSPP